jgi:hypothetical protein
MKKVTLFALVMAISLVTAPVFAAEEGSVKFAALNSMATEVTPLPDEQLAAVEGGRHLSLVITLLRAARIMESSTLPGFPQNIPLAQILQNTAISVLSAVPAHSCSGAAGNC